MFDNAFYSIFNELHVHLWHMTFEDTAVLDQVYDAVYGTPCKTWFNGVGFTTHSWLLVKLPRYLLNLG